ncbi:MAG: hypothetical protein ABID61_00650 [Candidatus Micrarchaeota archaeon]
MRLNARLAYFLGALNSDGTFYNFFYKKRNRIIYRIRFQVGEKSLPMLNFIQKIFELEFNRSLTICKDEINSYGTGIYSIGTSVNSMLVVLDELGIIKGNIPEHIRSDTHLFCAYLAGLIDGDGDIRIKRPKWPQCEIRITVGKPDDNLIKLISFHLKCSARIEKFSCEPTIEGRKIQSTGYRHCFYLSKKNMTNFMEFVFPFIQLEYKKQKVMDYLSISNIC